MATVRSCNRSRTNWSYVHKNTAAKGRSTKTQADDFVDAEVGDYFYLTNGNKGIYTLGQFTGPANILSEKGQGWLDRPFRVIAASRSRETYTGQTRWWTPNENSTFTAVPPDDLTLFEELILSPYFDIRLSDYGIN